MKLKLFPRLTTVSAEYEAVHHCPLCGSDGILQGHLMRDAYRFGLMRIPLPRPRVALMACWSCDLLWKDLIPTAESISHVMQRAPDEWKPKGGDHPAVPGILPYLADDLLDVGASQGDLLEALRPHAVRLSALDIVRYENCRPTGEYILGQFEDDLQWSGIPYSTVTAFDIFEHFLDAGRAVKNITQFIRPGGHLVIETGDWRSVADLSSWYYVNLFEHQIFWSAHSIRYLAESEGLTVLKCERVNHKGRRNNSPVKRMALNAFRSLGRLADPVFGIDSRLVPPPLLEDHLFAVLRKQVAVVAVSA